MRDDQGKIIGVVYGSLSLARIKTLVEGAPTDAEGAGLEVVVVNDRNQLVVHPKNPLFTTREPGAWNPRYEMADSGQRIAIDPLMEAGSRYLVGSKRFASGEGEGAKEWTVTVLRDQVAIVSKIDALGSAISKFQNGVAGFVLALIVAAMAAIVSLRQRIQGSS